MKKRFFSMTLLLGMTLAFLTAALGFAERDVTVEHLKYGSEAFELHRADRINTFDCEGITYQLEDKWFAFDPSIELFGGKTRSVYEYTVPQYVTTDFVDKPCVLGTITIAPEGKTTLTVGEGNRMSGVFTLGEPMELTDVYSEQITLPRNAQGNPVLIDKIYLYSFEEKGETQYYAATFYVDYEGYKASHRGAENNATQPVAADVRELQPSVEPTVEPTEEERKTSPWTYVCSGIVLATIIITILSRKRPAKPKQAEAPESPTDDIAELQVLAAEVRDETVRTDLRRFIDVCMQIRKAVREKPEKAAQTHKFFNYYVPTVKRLVQHLITTEQRTTQPDEMKKALETVRYGVKMACTAVEKQLANMYRREQMDADADITVMENMLKMDGFTDAASPFAADSEKDKNG